MATLFSLEFVSLTTKDKETKVATCNTLLKLFANVNEVVVEDVNFSEHSRGDGTVVATIDIRPYKRFKLLCPFCGSQCPRYDNGNSDEPATWRAPDCNGIVVYLRSATCRVECLEHGVVTAAVPWAYPRSRFTRDFDHMVAWLAPCMAKTQIAEFMRIDWKTVGRCISRVRTDLEPDITRRYDNLVNIGIDETSYRKGHKYVTTVVNHDTNCVVWVHDGHGKAVLSEFFEALTPEQRASIKAVSGDGARWIDDCIQEYIPHATRCVDPFHVVTWGSKVLDDIRREVWRYLEGKARAKKTQANKVKNSKKNNAQDKANKLSEQAGSLNKLAESVKKAAYTLYKRQDELTPADLCRIGQLHAADPKIIKAFILQDRLRRLFQGGFTREVAEPELAGWIAYAKRTEIPQIVDLAVKIERHFQNILNTIELGLSNARIEAMNNKIKLIIRRAYGFRNIQSLCDMVLLVCSNLQIPLRNHVQKPRRKPRKKDKQSQTSVNTDAEAVSAVPA